jgi:hypothetical protein
MIVLSFTRYLALKRLLIAALHFLRQGTDKFFECPAVQDPVILPPFLAIARTIQQYFVYIPPKSVSSLNMVDLANWRQRLPLGYPSQSFLVSYLRARRGARVDRKGERGWRERPENSPSGTQRRSTTPFASASPAVNS